MEQIVPTPRIDTGANPADAPRERRGYQRLDMSLPVEVVHVGGSSSAPIRSTTRNVSPAGIYFDAPAGLLEPGNEVHFLLSVPPGPGYSPYAGRGTGVAEIVRIDPLAPDAHAHPRVGVAARFSQPLKFAF